MRKSPWILLLFVLLGGLLGWTLGKTLQVIAPQGTIQNIFSTAIHPGFGPLTVDLVIIKLTLGFAINMNLLTFLGILLGLYLYKQF